MFSARKRRQSCSTPVTGTRNSVLGLGAPLQRKSTWSLAVSSRHLSPTLASTVRHAARSCDAFPTRSISTRCPMRSSYLASSMVDGTLDAGSRGADVELRSRADRGSHSLARGCLPRRSPLEVDRRCPGAQASSTALRRGALRFRAHALKLEYKAGHEDVVAVKRAGARIARSVEDQAGRPQW